MKNILLSLSVILTMVACSDKADTTASQMPIVPVYGNSVSSDTAKPQDNFYQPVQPATRPRPERVRTVYVTVPAAAPVATVPPAQPTPVVIPSNTGTLPSSTGVDNSGNTETASTIPQPEKKKGWSKAAKGAVIGAGAGAIGGAILSKKKGVGAIVGGVIGAAGGYVIGKGMDKKDNRLITN